MSKRILAFALIVVFVVSLAAFAVMPGTHTTPTAKSVQPVTSIKSVEPTGPSYHPPTCPDPGAPGCGGG